ncbi:uncharacterized protein LOC124266261 [Haliotis rubra]|uniref:uncharacterized protein LOC124266261 n=1 Tax=Haliotis rubra TaxID=36100 RepID=UPI001EE5ED2E|nr:uncharacterized protein LOC124266261 [Haliotis rubra]
MYITVIYQILLWYSDSSRKRHTRKRPHSLEGAGELRDDNSELSFSGETSTYESADDMSRSRNEDGYWSEVTESDDDDMEAIQSSDDAREAGEIQLQDKSRDDSLRDCAEQTIKERISGTASSPLLPHVTKCLKEHSCTTIIGQPGDGKTTLAFQVLSEMHKRNGKFMLWKHHRIIFGSKRVTDISFFFNNIFGNPNFQFDHYRKWHPVLLDMDSYILKTSAHGFVFSTFMDFRAKEIQRSGELFRTCAKWNHAEGCEVLLKYVEVNSTSKRGNTALHYAASLG